MIELIFVETSEIIRKIQEIEIKSKGLTQNLFSGEYHSAFKGRGMTFSEVRPYQFGDDVRSIDWNVTARYKDPHVKVFEEERELTLVFVVDVSASGDFGSTLKTKKELALEVMGVLLFSALANNDQFGAVFVSDCIEKYIPPSKGKKQALHILHQLLSLNPIGKKTNIKLGLDHVRDRIKKRSIAFVISDFVDDSNYLDSLRWMSKKHDTIAIQVIDSLEEEIPNMGIVQFYHAETGEQHWVDTSIPEVRRFISKQVDFRSTRLSHELKRMGAEHLILKTAEDFVKPLHQFFKKR